MTTEELIAVVAENLPNDMQLGIDVYKGEDGVVLYAAKVEGWDGELYANIAEQASIYTAIKLLLDIYTRTTVPCDIANQDGWQTLRRLATE